MNIETSIFIEVNNAYAKMLGYSVNELLNISCKQLMLDEDKESRLAMIQETIDIGFITDYEKRCVKKDGSIIFVNMATTLMDDKKTILISVRDVTKNINLINELKESREELKLLASLDPMTQLYNRRYFNEMSTLLCDVARRNKIDLSVLMIDIDKFKNINDSYGHSFGDEVIKKLALVLHDITRESDIATRWGGEEFLILLNRSDREGSVLIAQKILQAVREIKLETVDKKEFKFTVSIGVSQVSRDQAIRLEDTIIEADKALYKAKVSGRDRICTFDSEVSSDE